MWPNLSSPVPSPLSLLRHFIQSNNERKDIVEPVTLLPISIELACLPAKGRSPAAGAAGGARARQPGGARQAGVLQGVLAE